MRLVYIFQSFAHKAGTERILTDKMNYFAEKLGYEVHFITYEQGGHKPVYQLSPKIKWVDINVRFFPLYKLGTIKRIFARQKLRKKFKSLLYKEIEKIDPDFIICTTYPFAELDILANIPGRAKKILESHVARKTIERKFQASGKLQYCLACITDNHILKEISKFSMIVTLTNYDKNDWGNITNTTVIPNLLTYYPEQSATPEVKKRIISIGRLYPQKGFDLLIKAWKIVHRQHPDWILDIYGEGIEHANLLKDIEYFGLKNVINIHKFTDNIYDKYMESDLYVLSSRWEGFGLVLIEAMSCGIPCVSFDCTYGPADIIQDKVDGILVENGNIEQLAEKICYLIENEDIRKRMGGKARENVKRYLPENIMSQWEELFDALLSKRVN